MSGTIAHVSSDVPKSGAARRALVTELYRSRHVPMYGPANVNSPSIVETMMEFPMDWDQIEGNWKQFRGKIKEKWGQLTDDEIDKIDGKRDQLEGSLQARYGYAKEKAQQVVDEWLGKK